MRRFGECVFIFVFLSFTDGQNDIRLPPYITRGPRLSSIFRADSAVTLECKGEGSPTVAYEWKKNGAVLNLNVHNIRKGTDGIITIQPASSLDEGYYQCFVRNQFGTALSVTSHLQKAFLESTTGTPSVTHLTVKEGEPFHIQATTKISFPKATYAWEVAIDTVDKNPSALTYSQRVQVADNGDLYFAYAVPEDELSNRAYRSTTFNPYLDVRASGSYTRVTVTRGAQTQFEPTLAFSSEAVTVDLIGEQVSLRCFFSGNPAPDITWKGPRNSLPRDRYTLDKYKSELTIRNIEASDEGDYTCTGRNSKGENSHKLQLKVEARPTFKRLTDGPHDQNVEDGGEAIFNCNAEAIPDATVVWLQNGNPIDVNAPPRKFVFSNGGKTLTVRRVCRTCDGEDRQTDLTVIQCNASNVHGYAFASGYLNVHAKIRIISREREEVSVDVNEHRSLNFECDVAFDPNSPPNVRWYKIINANMEPVNPDPPALVLIPAKGKPSVTLSITIFPNGKDRWTDYDGEYRCVASNGYFTATKVVVLKIKYYIPPADNGPNGRSRFSLIVVVSIAGVLIGFVLLILIFARIRKNHLPRNNLVNETVPRRRTAGTEDSTLPVYNAIRHNDYPTVDNFSHFHPPPPYGAAIQPTYVAPRANAPPCNEFTSSDTAVANAQTWNTAYCRY